MVLCTAQRRKGIPKLFDLNASKKKQGENGIFQ